MLYLVLLHLVGLTGGLLGKKCKIPAGALLGAMAFVIVLNLITGIEQAYPVNLRVVVQVFSGILIGMTFTRGDIAILRHMIKPVLILLISMFGLSILFALILAHFTRIDPVTAVFATAPGGLSDLVLIAADFGADTRQVALLHVFRFGFIVAFFPLYIKHVVFRKYKRTDGLAEAPIPKPPAGPNGSLTTRQKALRILLTVSVGGSTAFFARYVGIPAGAVIGAIAATIVLGAGLRKAFFPKQARGGVQIFAGCFIGSQITLTSLTYIQELPGPLAIVLVQVLVVAFVVAFLLHRLSGMEPASSLFSGIPGGLSEMGILAEEMGLDVPKIVLMHTCRLVTAVSMMPLLFYAFLHW